MAITTCPPGQWTIVPDTGGSMLLESRGMGFYVDTTGTPPANPAAGYALASNASLVIEAGLTVNVYPAGPKEVIAVSNPV